MINTAATLSETPLSPDLKLALSTATNTATHDVLLANTKVQISTQISCGVGTCMYVFTPNGQGRICFDDARKFWVDWRDMEDTLTSLQEGL